MVIFGCGYLGARVARVALRAGAEVTALTRNPDRAEQVKGAGVQRVVLAELDAREWHPLIDSRADFVLDCVSSAGGGEEGYRRSYLEGMRSILQWASQGEVGRLVFTSSTSVYAQDDGNWVTEADCAQGAGEGGEILRQAEVLLENAPPAVRRRFVLRLGGIYGPGRHSLLDRALAGAASAEGDDILLNPIHIDDVVAAVWAAFRAGDEVNGGIFNIVDDQPSPKAEVIRYLREKAKARGLVAAESPSPGPPVRRRTRFRANRRISNRKAGEILGWRPRYPDYRAGYEPLLEAR